MKEAPQLLEAVLQRRSGNEKSVIRIEILERLVEERIIILQSMCLIDHQTSPTDASEKCFVFQDNFICR